MRRNKVGAILIALQMAVTLGVLCNGLFLIEQRVSLSNRPTGVNEDEVFVITNQWVGHPVDLSARVRADLAALRGLTGVIDAFASNSFPLSNVGSAEQIKLRQDQLQWVTQTAVYFADEHAISSLGLNLIAGRDFTSGEILERGDLKDLAAASPVIVTRALADKLFSRDNALGHSIFLQPENRTFQIVGIVERLQAPWVQGWPEKYSEHSIIEPIRFASSYLFYVVRAKPGQQMAVLKQAEQRLFDLDHERVLEKSRTFKEARAEAYRDDRGLAILLATICSVLLTITTFGIAGLTSYWVVQRRRQIGIRRALGATRSAIVQYFQVENLMIAVCGATLGVLMAMALNLWMVSEFETGRLHVRGPIIGAVLLLLLGQAAVLFPALKAASIPAVLAIRGE
jgi:putative ABC transport system permease protein